MPSAAENYLASFPPEKQQQIRDSWGGQDLMEEWFQNAVKAGDPGAVQAQGGEDRFRGGYSGSSAHNGYDENYGAKKLPKPGPNPTPDEIRAYSWDQGWGTDDYGDITNGQIQQWIDSGKWDPQAGRFKNDYGDYVDKPYDDGPKSAGRQSLFNTGRYASPNDVRFGPGAGVAGGGVPGQPAAAKPTTFGAAGDLTYTGNPLTDALIYQFNNQRQLGDQSGQALNIFGLRNERTRDQANTEGTPQDIQGQLLKGGGLWWTDKDQSKDVFKGWRVGQEQKKKRQGGGGGGAPGYSTQPATTQPAAQPPPATAPGNTQPAAQPPPYKKGILEENKMTRQDSGYGPPV